MRLSSRRADDADLIRARLRALLSEGQGSGGWLPDDPLDEEPGDPLPRREAPATRSGEPDSAAPQGAGEEDGALPAGVGRHRAPGPAVRVAPGRPGVRALLVAGLVGALILVGWTWLSRPAAEPVDGGSVGGTSRSAPASPSVGTAAETAATVTVSVVGQVARPGLVVLPEGSRVADALAAAGGLAPGADPAAVNLAAVVTDGQQIAVGVPAPGAPPAVAGAAAGGRVLLNSATPADLDALPGIGPVLAQRIVDHRTENGPFTAVEQLEDVSGIGPATFEELVHLVAV
ncbi:ComEA family DNA-binding protein [Blastococcus sp. TF02A-26]|uniref:ComEA family DNA-binding protein n=1 Tax=Blastococcus sp. TF02A-26 TaxID=2250577 RepID=UPI000DE8F2EC|nr:ComEA family DNA-binding protein [Blastococcus sp. TF02A-26]RBY83158.1 competence protein ComEA [Blastococcus sp. TF02A-26]